MKLNKICLSMVMASAALLAGASSAHDITPGKAAKGPLLLTGLTVHTVTNGVKADTDVLVVDGKIAAIGQDLAAPEGTTVMELTGKHVYPGLIAMANQMGLIEIEAVRATVDSREITDTNPDIKAKVAYNADSEMIPTVRRNGIAYSMVYPDGAMLMGQSSLMQLDAWNYQDALVADGIGLHIRWPNASTLSSRWNPRPADEIRKANAEQLAKLEQYFKDAKAYYDAEKAGINKGVDSRWHEMIAVFDGKRPLFVHANDERQIRQAMLFAKQYQLQLTIVGGADSWRLADELAKANVSVIYHEPHGLPARADENYNQAFAAPKVLQDAGVNFALSLDGYRDISNVAFGAGQAVSYGLTKEQALRSVTINAAQIAGVADKLGSIEVGKAASLVVSEGDIFDYLGHKVTHLWIDGRAVDLNNRHQQLHDKYKQRINQ